MQVHSPLDEIRAADADAAAPTLAPPGRSARRKRVHSLGRALGVYGALVLLVLASAILQPTLLSPANLILLLRQASIIGLLSVGETIVMLTGGIDLSVGSVVGVVNWVSTSFLDGSDRWDVPVIALCLGIGALVGLINGLGVTKLRIPPFVMTLGMLYVVQAAGFMYTNGVTKGAASSFLLHIGQGFVGPLPTAMLVWAGVVVLAWLAMHRLPYGRRVYAIGANPRASRLTGVNVHRVLIMCYVLSGLTAALGGLVLSGYIGIGDNTSGSGYELDAIAAVVVGGTALTGGRGGVIGTLGGVLLLALLYNLLVILNIAQFGRLLVQGAAIVIAAAVYSRSR